MKKSLRICGYTTSTFKFGNDTLYAIKYDDGRFEYRGGVTIPAKTSTVNIPHPFSPANNVSAVATNCFSNNRTIFVSSTCDNSVTRIDATDIGGNIPSFSCYTNVHVQGFWK